MLNSNKIAFLFGAGVSIPSGLPKTEELTEKILKGENIVRLSERYIYVDEPEKYNYIWENEYINRFKKLFHILQNYFGKHYAIIDRTINYEDYYFMIDSMHSEQNMESENPIIEYFSDYLFKTHTSLFEPLCDLYSPLRLIDLMGEVKNYIRDLVAYYLSKPPKYLTQFSLLNDINIDRDYSQAFIFTLNHDTLIEQYLKTNKIQFSDGFVNRNQNARIWDANSYKEKVNLFKLHGSIEWSNFESIDPYERQVCIYNAPQRSIDTDSPVLIIGSFNKLRDYSRGTIFDLQCLFSKYLNESNRLIISGYSFGDQGINSRIINWLYGMRDRKIIIIHKNDDELFQNARPAIQRILQRIVKEKSSVINIIPKWFEETNWDEIKYYA
jgi:hypothetical protein